MATHEVRQMMLDKPIREALTMSTGIETKKANVEPYNDRPELTFTNRNRIHREEHDFFKVDWKRCDMGNAEENVPLRVTCASVLDRVGLMATGKQTPPILRTKTRPGAPVIGNGTDMSAGKGRGFA